MAADLDPSAALCPCGIRGCDLAAAHKQAFVVREPYWRRPRVRKRRH